MALRGKKPTEIQKRLKAFFYGAEGVGKTYAAIHFPAPYLIDTEKGAEHKKYTDILIEKNGAILQTNVFEEMINEVRELLKEKHVYKTVIIDSLTMVYDDLVAASAKKLAKPEEGKDGTEFGRHISEANRQMKQLMNLLLRLDMNVIVTAHAKNEYGQGMVVLGQTYDCYKKIGHLFDVVFEVQRRGKERYGVIKKTRIEGFPDSETIPFSYDELSKRYGKETLEKESIPEALATSDQVEKLKHLVEMLKFGEEVTQKWLDKASSSCFEEMKTSDIQHYINEIEKRINKVD